MSCAVRRLITSSNIRNIVHHPVYQNVPCTASLPSRNYNLYSNIKIVSNTQFITDPRISKCAFLTSDAALKEKEVVSSECDKLYRCVEVECRGLDRAVLRSYCQFITAASNHLQITLHKVEIPRYHLQRKTVQKSVFVHGKHKVQYEIRTYYLIMQFKHLTSSTADTFLEYIERNVPEGVALKITKEELMKFPEHVKNSDQVAPSN